VAQNRQIILDRSGAWAEFHVNNTLHRELNAVRYRWEDAAEAQEKSLSFLFDGLVLPVSSDSLTKNPSQNPLTECDHVLICRKGIFSIETKSVVGRVFGEKDADDWHTATKEHHDRNRNNLRSRMMKNPFKQNYKHIRALANHLGLDYKKVHNCVILLEADYDGWLEGDWGSTPIDGLFLSAPEMVRFIHTLPDKLPYNDMIKLSKKLVEFYEKKDDLKAQFMSNMT
jgi:hypothetical protein